MTTIAVPRYCTARTSVRKNLLSLARKIAAILGYTLLDWQENFIAIATELDDEGRFVYRDVTLLVPRQNGKTTLLAVLLILRCIATPESHLYYAAQSGKDGRLMLLDNWAKLLAKSDLKGTYQLRQTNGSESIRFDNGSTISLLSSTTSAGHGVQSDGTVLDEAFSYTDSRLENAAVPAFSTRYSHGPGPQLIVVSTAGTADSSPYLRNKVEHGRRLVEDGVTEGSMYCEYSAPDGADAADPEVWYRCNPALGPGGTITEQAVRDELRTMDVTDFSRSRLNQWTSSLVDPVVPLSVWASLTDRFSTPGNDIVLAFDSTPDGARSSIAIASQRTDGRIHVELIDNQEGIGWLAARIKQLERDHAPRYIVCDAKSPAANILPELGMQVRELNAVEACKHYAGFVAACNEGVLVHREDSLLTTALSGAVRRSLGDAFAWSRRNSSIDVSPIVAVSMALYITQAEGQGQGVWSLREIIAEREKVQQDDFIRLPDADAPAAAADGSYVLPSGVKVTPIMAMTPRRSALSHIPDQQQSPVDAPMIGTPTQVATESN